MYKRLKADKDTYITNRVIKGSRTTDANTGQAGTLDLFKLYDESSISGVTGSINELSRILIHFNLDPLRALTGSKLDLSDSSFKATLKMRDVFGGQTIPSNFNVVVFPLAKDWSEGNGRDTRLFRDLDSANFVSATNDVTWSQAGASASGSTSDSNVDIYETADFGLSFATQAFPLGTEDLAVDVTNIVSATLKGDIPDYGFRISFSGSQETDDKTRFVKRFTSRHANDPALRPSLECSFDDSILDNHKNFYFDVSGSLFLTNYSRGVESNIIFQGAEVTGNNSLILKIFSGSGSTYFEKILTASQYSVGSNFQSGTYFSTFAIATNETGSLQTEIINAGSATFTEVWTSLDETLPFLSSTLVVTNTTKTAFSSNPDSVMIFIKNLEKSYKSTEEARFHIFAQRPLITKATKVKQQRDSIILDEMYYQVVDYNSRRIVIPFEETNNGTRVSSSGDGMYFDLHMDSLEIGRTYAFEFKYKENGVTEILEADEVGAIFVVKA